MRTLISHPYNLHGDLQHISTNEQFVGQLRETVVPQKKSRATEPMYTLKNTYTLCKNPQISEKIFFHRSCSKWYRLHIKQFFLHSEHF